MTYLTSLHVMAILLSESCRAFFYSYATRVRSIINDATKNTASKEVIRLRKLVSHWKEQAGRGPEEELEDIIEQRTGRLVGDVETLETKPMPSSNSMHQDPKSKSPKKVPRGS